jgi:hypothetical protein
MAEEFGPDQELASRAERLRQARLALAKIRQPEWQLREGLGLPYGPLLPGQDVAVARADSQAYYGSPEAGAVEFAEKSLEQGVEDHPQNLLASAMAGAEKVRVPELSGFQWAYANPSLLTAVPRSDDDRLANARQMYILDKIRPHTQRHPPGSPLAIDNYYGPGKDILADAMVEDRYFQENPAIRKMLASPYEYVPDGYSPEMEKLSPEQLITDPLNRATSAVYGGLSRFSDNYLAFGRDMARGQGGSAFKDFVYGIPNLVSPVFHRGGPGSEQDWRPDAGSMAAPIEVAGQLPFLFYRGVMPKRALPAGERIRQLVDPDVLNAAYRSAARRHHPDVGGTTEAMQMLNRLRDMGDVQGIARMAQ